MLLRFRLEETIGKLLAVVGRRYGRRDPRAERRPRAESREVKGGEQVMAGKDIRLKKSARDTSLLFQLPSHVVEALVYCTY